MSLWTYLQIYKPINSNHQKIPTSYLSHENITATIL